MGNVAEGEAGLALDGAQSADEKLEAPRFALLIRTAKLISASGEYVCVVRDVSATGVKVRLFHPLPQQPVLMLELANGDRYPVERVWENGGDAGLRFTSPVAVAHLVAETGAYRKRPVRLRLQLAALISVQGDSSAAIVRDLSQQGAQIESTRHLAMDQQLRLEIAQLAPIFTKVRWRRHPAYGLVFEQTFQLDELARLAAMLQPPVDRRLPLGDGLLGPLAKIGAASAGGR